MPKQSAEPFAPENITKEHILTAAQIIDEDREPIKPSTGYDVIINGRFYPPKEIMRLGNRLANGVDEWPRSGGEATNKYLEELGFTIRSKSGQNTVEEARSEANFLKVLDSLPPENARTYLSLAGRLIAALGVSPDDPRMAYGVNRGKSLAVTVSNRYCLTYFPKQELPFAFISSVDLSDDPDLRVSTFDGPPRAYYNRCKNLDAVLRHEQALIDASRA